MPPSAVAGRAARGGRLAGALALVVLAGARADAQPRGVRPYLDRAEAPKRAECPDPIAGTWRARVWRPESYAWDRVTLSIKRSGRQLSGWIVVETWDGDEDQGEPPTCDDGTPALDKWRERLSGSYKDGAVDLRGSRVRKLAAACEPPGDASTYRPDHFSGKLDLAVDLLVTTNNDGSVDDDRPHHFERISCKADVR